jgi:hypothetical protein
MLSLLTPLALNAATNASSWRLSTTMSGSDSSRWYSNKGKRNSSVLTSRCPSRAGNRLTFTSMPRRASSCLSASPSFRQGSLGAKESKARSRACPHKQCHRQHEALHRCNAPVSSEKYIGPGPSLRFGGRRAACEREAEGGARRVEHLGHVSLGDSCLRLWSGPNGSGTSAKLLDQHQLHLGRSTDQQRAERKLACFAVSYGRQQSIPCNR